MFSLSHATFDSDVSINLKCHNTGPRGVFLLSTMIDAEHQICGGECVNRYPLHLISDQSANICLAAKRTPGGMKYHEKQTFGLNGHTQQPFFTDDRVGHYVFG